MALITTAARSELIALYVAMFKAAPGAANLTDMVTAYEAGGTTATIAKTLAAKADFATVYPGFSTGAEFSASLVANLLGADVTPAITTWAEGYVLGLLNAGKSRADAIVTAVVALRATTNTEFTVAQAHFANDVDVASYYSITKGQGTATSTLATLQGVIAGVNSVAASATTAKATIDTAITAVTTAATASATAAAALANTLTTSVQTLTGTAGDDTFNAPAGTWGAGDIVSGGTAGTDTLNATITGTGPTQSATSLVSIEVLNLTASPNPATLDLTGVTGLTQVNNVSSASGATLTVTGVGNAVNTTITGGGSSTSVTYATAASVVLGTTDASTLTLAGTAAGTGFTTGNIEALTIRSTVSANTLSSLSDAAMTSLILTGDQAITLGTLGTDGFQTSVGNSGLTVATSVYNAAAVTGTGAVNFSTGNGAGAPLAGGTAVGVTVTAPTAGTGAFTVKTGNNNDSVTLGAGVATVSTGTGNDTIVGGAANSLITAGAGNDTLTLGAGTETIRFDLAASGTNSDTINNFDITKDVLSFNLGSTAAAGGSSTPVYGVIATVVTGAATPTASTVGNVDGTGTTTAFAASQFAAVAGGVATANTIPQAAAIVALNGSLTDGTAAGVVTALGATGLAGVSTTANGKFLLVTYSVGNIAQVWSYNGDSTLNTDIDSAELQLVAQLSNITPNTLTAANFSAYTAAAATTAGSVTSAGQTFTITTPLTTVNTAANANGQFFTAATDTVTVALGALPSGAQTTTMGLTLLDSQAGDGDVLNATVLNAGWNLGTVLTNIENVNLTMLVSDTDGFAMTTVMPGATTLTVGSANAGTIGTQATNQPAATGLTNVLSGTALGFASGYNGQLNYTGTALAALTLNLGGNTPTAGSVAITSPTFNSTALITTLTVNPQAASTINADAQTAGVSATSVFNATTTNVTGSGNLNILGLSAQFNGSQINAATAGTSSTVYTGALTITPTDNGAMDFTGTTTSAVTGVRTVDLSLVNGFNSQITMNASNNSAAYGASGAVGVVYSPAAAGALTGLAITASGTASTDALSVTTGALATAITNGINATGYERVTLNLGATTTAVGGTSFGGTALVGTQALTVNSTATTGALALGTVTGADTISTTGVSTTGIVSFALANGAVVGTTVTGGNSPHIIGEANATLLDSITTGTAGDVFNQTAASGGTVNLGAGNDTYALFTTTGTLTIADTSGTDTILIGATGSTVAVNIGGVATLQLAGIEQIVMPAGGVMTVRGGQIASGTGLTVNNTVAAAGTVGFTLNAAGGVLSLAGVTTTALVASAANGTGYLGTTGTLLAGAAPTSFVLVGAAGNDTITGSALADNITGGAGNDVLSGGAGADIFRFDTIATISAAANSKAILDFTTASDTINFGTVGNGAGATLLGITLNPAATTAAAFAPNTVDATAVADLAAVYTAINANAAFNAGNFVASGAGAAGIIAKTISFATGAAAGTYLVVNDSTAAFQAANDIVIRVVGTVVATDLTFTS